MSTATPFIFPRSFPFCVTDISGSVDAAATYVDNLTLTQAMAFAWNLETFTITTAGTGDDGGSKTINANANVTVGTISSDVFNEFALNDESMWFGAAVSAGSAGSMPAIRVPRARVCDPGISLGCILDFGFNDTTSHPASGYIIFWLGTDPGNAGKYRIYYRLLFSFGDTLTDTIAILFKNQTTPTGSETAITNGTITIGGITFPWYAYYTTGVTSTSGVGMTATTGSFTY